MASSSSLPHLLFLLALTTSAVAVLGGGGGGKDDQHGLTHIRLYVHENSTGANATYAPVLQPLGGSNSSSSFGSMGVVDDEIRVGADRSSPLVGRYQAVFFGTSLRLALGYTSSVDLVFTAGEFNGSTLSVQGPVLGFDGTIERAVVGGTGRFRLAQGYMLLRIISRPTPQTDVNEMNLFVLMHPAGKY